MSLMFVTGSPFTSVMFSRRGICTTLYYNVLCIAAADLMTTKARMNISVLRQASEWVPVGMSLAALGVVVGPAAMYGIVHEADEGAAAHIFQILMVAQVPVGAYFAVKWLPRFRGETLRVLALQVGAALAAYAAVYWLT
jgi:hypothetical protein